MSRIYEALKRMELERRPTAEAGNAEPGPPVEILQKLAPEPFDLHVAASLKLKVSSESRLATFTDPHSLGAEKFRALATRLEHARGKRQLKSLLVTSSVAHEGKTFVAANLAITLAKNCGARVLLVEGDLHRPSLASLLGSPELRGINQWWSAPSQDLSENIYRFEEIPLWLLAAGGHCDQPSSILQSARFAEALFNLIGTFDWVIVDSTPMLPFVDANLWSRLLDGTLLVVREQIASVKALKKGLESIDNLNLVGVILNDADDFDPANYEDQYYALQTPGRTRS